MYFAQAYKVSRVWSIALGATIALLLTLPGCDGEQASGGGQAPPPEVAVAQVLSKSVQQWDEYTGRVSAIDTVELRPRVSGYVQSVAYKEGQDVKQGDLMFQSTRVPTARHWTTHRRNWRARAWRSNWKRYGTSAPSR